MTNFGFLKEKKEYALFSASAIEAERVYESSPAVIICNRSCMRSHSAML